MKFYVLIFILALVVVVLPFASGWGCVLFDVACPTATPGSPGPAPTETREVLPTPPPELTEAPRPSPRPNTDTPIPPTDTPIPPIETPYPPPPESTATAPAESSPTPVSSPTATATNGRPGKHSSPTPAELPKTGLGDINLTGFGDFAPLTVFAIFCVSVIAIVRVIRRSKGI